MTERESRVGSKLMGPSKLTVAVAVVGLVLSMGIHAFADSPNPASTTGSVTRNASTTTVTLSGTLAWGKKGTACQKSAGVAIDWQDSDQAGNPVGPAKNSTLTASVGVLSSSAMNTQDNAIHPAGCTGGVMTWGPISHVYKTSQKTITACPVGYHVKGKNPTAGGPGRDTDNSIEENSDAPSSAACFSSTPPPPPHRDTHPALTIDKKVNGGDHASVADELLTHKGDILIYTVAITNTGDVPLTMSNLQDNLHANLEADCNHGNGFVLQPGDEIDCTYLDTVVRKAHNIASVTGTPSGGNSIDVSDGTFQEPRAGNVVVPGTPPTPVAVTPHTAG